MSDAAPILAEAKQRHQAGLTDEADALYRQVLSLDPDNVDALHMRGVLASQRGEVDAAIGLIERAAALNVESTTILSNLGTVYRSAGRLAQAEASFRAALDMQPTAAMTRFNLANTLAAQGQLEAAIAEYERALRDDPGNPGIRNNLAAALKTAGRFESAVELYRRLVEEFPKDAQAKCNLGVLCMDLGLPREAAALYRAAIALDPDALEPRNNLGVTLLELGMFEEAVQCLRGAVARDGTVAAAHENLGNALRKVGDIDDADGAYAAALALQPSAGVEIKKATLLPVVADSSEEMTVARRRMADSVAALLADPPQLHDANREVGATNFNLSYHDTNNRDVQADLARLYEAACPSLAFVADHCRGGGREPGRRLKLGFVSRQFGTNAVGWCFHGVVRFMPRDTFSVTVFRVGASDDPLWRRMADDADRAVILPMDLAAARQRIAEEELDVLVYTDIGMEPMTYFLAFARLAPVQAVLGGHPDTIGIAALDRYISSDLQEPPDANDHYSETLVRLPGAPTYYERPSVPAPVKPRAAFDLPEDTPLYFCAQTLIKLHPDMDALFAGILERDRAGLLLLPTGYNPRLAEKMKARFARTLGDAMDRVRFLPTMSHTDFLTVMKLADVSLDTRPFGGGNTCWQAIAMGTPIVTWPGRFLRGRYALALYSLMGITDTVAESAEEYVDIAVRWATDRALRSDLEQRIEATASCAFEDMTHVQALHDVLKRLAEDGP